MKFLDIPEPIDEELSRFSTAASVRLRAGWFVQLRWIAILSAFLLAVMAEFILPAMCLKAVLFIIGLLALTNACYILFYFRTTPTKLQVEIHLVKLQMVIDLFILTMLLHYTGGIENPLFFLYFIHVIISSIMFKGREIYQIAGFAIVLFMGEVILSSPFTGSGVQIFQHHHILSETGHFHNQEYLFFMLGSFCLVILITAFVASSMMNRYRVVRDKLVKNQMKILDAEKEKMEYFRFVTHELKSPIATIHSAIETVLDITAGKLEETPRKLLERIIGRSQQMLDMVKDLSEMTQGVMPQSLEIVELDIIELVSSIAGAEFSGNTKNLQLELKLPEDKLMIKTYPDLLGSILTNLISNAVRYSRDNGHVEVTVIDQQDKVFISVRDEGIGMSAEDIKNIFKEFYRSPAAKQFTKIGTGLGMTIVKRFVEKLGGKIAVDSLIDKGSTFKLTIPKHV